MNSKPKLVVKLPKALQEDSRAPKPQSAKPQKKRKQPEGESGSQLSAGRLAAAKEQPQGPAPTVKKKFKVFGPGSLKPASSAFTTHGGPELIKPRISVKFGAAGKPSVSISGGPSGTTQRQHAAPAAASSLPKEAKQPVRESPRNVALRPKDAQPGQSKGPGKKKKQFRLSEANGNSTQTIKVSLPRVPLQSGPAPCLQAAEASVQEASSASAVPQAPAAETLANGTLHASAKTQPVANFQEQPGAPAQRAPPKPALRPMPSGPPEQLQVQRVIQRMQKKDPYRIFAEVPSEEMAPGYSKVITRPMAFSIMWDRFRRGEYMTWEELQADLNQMYRNAMTYNRPETVFHKQAAKMLQIGAKVLDNVRMGAKPVARAKTSAAAVKAPRDGLQPERQPEQEKKLVSEPRVLRPQRRPPKAVTTMKTARRAANTQYRPKAGVRAATAAALSAAEDNLPRETYLSRVTRVLGAHQWKGLSLGATAEDVPFASGRPLARPAMGALPSGEQYGASLERFAAGLKGTALQKVLERKAQALKAPIAPAPLPVQPQQPKPPPMQATGNRNVVPSSGGIPITAPRPAWQTAPLYIQGASASLPQHANIHAQLAASAGQTLPKAAVPQQLHSRAATLPAQPALNFPALQIAGLFGQNQQPQQHVLAALQKQAELLMAQHKNSTIAGLAAAAHSRPSSAQSGQAGPSNAQSGQAGAPHAAPLAGQVQQVSSGLLSQQLVQQQMAQLAQQYRQGQATPPASVQQKQPP